MNNTFKSFLNLHNKVFNYSPAFSQQFIKLFLYRSYYLIQAPTKRQQKKILFILTHQRAGSTLLVHLLNTNPEILGYGETRLSYNSERDLDTLVGKVSWETNKSEVLEKYVMDKIVSNKFVLSKNLLNHENVYLIFLVREPEKSIQSILKSGFHSNWNEQDALKYYLERLSTLEECAKMLNNKERSLFFTHAQLIEQTEVVFDAVQDFLNLNYPLSEQYEVITTTSKRFVGDVSSKLKSGRIVKEHKASGEKISIQSVEKGLNGFNKCCVSLADYCTTIDSYI